MECIQPKQLHASRAYFTEFDRVTYSQVAWTPDDVEAIKRGLTRKLKLLTLTKGHVVIAASHLLESELARETILPHPELLSERVVVPALRSEFSSCEAFLDAKLHSESPGEGGLYRGIEQREMAQLIDASGLVVQWNVTETRTRFKHRLLADLTRENSLVGLLLRGKGLNVPDAMYAELENLPDLSRGSVYQVAKKHGGLEFREIICSYADFLYYLSGAEAVHSEGILPQENIVDFRLSDLASRQSPLSEHEVFFKIFVDIVKAATSSHFPTDLLEALTIHDTVNLHRIAMNEEFIQKYNAIQERTKAGLEMSDPERLVFLMKELDELERELEVEFSDAIDRELPYRLRQMRVRQATKFIHALASLILVPYGAVVGTTDIVVSGLRVLKRNDVASQIEERIDGGFHALARLVDGIQGGERPVLLQFVDHLKSRYADRLRTHTS